MAKKYCFLPFTGGDWQRTILFREFRRVKGVRFYEVEGQTNLIIRVPNPEDAKFYSFHMEENLREALKKIIREDEDFGMI